MTQTHRWKSLVTMTAFAIACSSSSTPPFSAAISTLARVDISPSSVSMVAGTTRQLSTTAYDQNNAVRAGQAVTWSSSNEAVVTVSNSGLLSAVSAGNATISASAGGVSGTASVTVTLPSVVVQSVAVQPDPVSVAVGATATLVAVPKDAQGNTITGKTASWSSATTSVATVNAAGVVTAVSLGTSVVTATVDGVSGSSTVTVASPPSGNVIDINTAQTFQTIQGWEGSASLGELDCNPTAFALYKGPVLDRLVNDLGMTRLGLGVRSGDESPIDYYQRYLATAQTPADLATWQTTWFTPVNDNADPNNASPAGFQWSFLDMKIDEIANPLRQRMQARGEKLYVVLTYGDFSRGAVKSFVQIKQPNEYAEFIAAIFQHMQQKYGWVPDAMEVLIEPQNAGSINGTITGADLGAATVAAGNRLASLGFHPDFIAPSDASMAGSVTYYDSMILTPGVKTYLKELAYHRYQGVSLASLQAIALRGQRDNLRTSMLEWNQADVDVLIEDLTVGNNSAWEQFTLANCGGATNPAATGIYFQVNQKVPTNPIVTMTYHARDYRQIFAYARPGAVRIGTVSGNPALLSPVAFRNANGKYVIVVRTQSAAAYTLRGVPAGTYGVNFNSQTQDGVNLSDAIVTSAGTLNSSTPSKGVITYYQR